QPALGLLSSAVSSSNNKLSRAAIFTIQGWRGEDALAAILATATGPEEKVSEDARVGLFQSLREMVPDVPAAPIAQWLATAPKAGPRARAQAVRVLAALHARAVLAAGPVLPSLLADPDPEVRKAALGLARDVRTEKAREALIALVRSGDRSGDERAL